MLHEAKLSEVGALKQRLLTLPRGFYEARQAVAEADKKVKDLKAEVKDGELEALLEASCAMTTDGKKVHSNEESRKAAASKALTGNAAHRDRCKRLSDAETELVNAQMRVSALEDEQRAFRAVADLTCAEISLIVAGR